MESTEPQSTGSFLDSIQKPPYTYEESFFERIKDLQPLIIYGAGLFAKKMIYKLQQLQIPISKIVVDDAYWHDGVFIEGYPVCSFSSISQDVNVNILVAFSIVTSKQLDAYQHKVKTYKNMNFLLIDSGILCTGSVLDNYLLSYNDILSNLKQYEEVFNLCADSLSKRVLTNFLNVKLTHDLHVLTETTPCQYFPPGLFSLNNDETFVDCGAYDGDSIKSFLCQVNNEYKKIYAFEPSTLNFEKLSKFVVGECLSDIVLINKGVFWREDILYFSDNGQTNSTIVANADLSSQIVSVQVTSIDDVISKNDDVTFIKMDIEGSELMALEGAKETIKRCRPKCAICVYHKKEDIYEIPRFLKSLHPDYKIYFRHHSYSSAELVCYAI